MLESIEIVKRNNNNYKYSVLIPSWNNLGYLKLCIESLVKNSSFPNQIIIIINEGSDGTLDWVKNETEFDYVHAEKNIGICYALNMGRKLISTKYLVYANDDMYFLPAWDKVLFDEIQLIGHKQFILSATMIEPTGNNACGVLADYGTDISSFKEKELLNNYKKLLRSDWSGSTWPPIIMHVDSWDLVGGMSIEFSPGMYSDPDLSRKLWEIGVRIFRGKGHSLVYHFGCKSTTRIKKNKGHKVFTLKWGVSAKTFMQDYLHRGEPAFEILPEIQITKKQQFNQFIKRIKSCL